MSEDTAGDGTVRDDEWRFGNEITIAVCVALGTDQRDPARTSRRVLDALRPHIAALIAQARADGAAEERERIAAALEAEADSTFNQTRAVNWRRAALMARGPS